MKIRFRKIIVMALTAALLLSLMSLISYAKDMEIYKNSFADGSDVTV